MVKNQLISIIIPVYNVERYLDRCVSSVTGQDYRNLEIILVDDGATDSCPRLCESWAGKDSRIKVIHKEHGGLSDARNAGLRVAGGDLIGFVDSDDWIGPEMYSRLKAALEKDQSDIAACSVEMVWEDEGRTKLLKEQENIILNRLEAQKELLYESRLRQTVCDKLYRRKVLEGVFFEKGKQHEDVFWSYKVIGNAERVSVIDYVGYYYRQRRESIMGADYSLKRLDAVKAYRERYKYISKNFPSLEQEARKRILADCIYHGQMAVRWLHGKDRKKALRYLEWVMKQYPMSPTELSGTKASHRLWLTWGQYSLKTVCLVKNILKIGL